MPFQSVAAMSRRCAHCEEPLRFHDGQPDALPVGNQLVCSEFCAQAMREDTPLAAARAP